MQYFFDFPYFRAILRPASHSYLPFRKDSPMPHLSPAFHRLLAACVAVSLLPSPAAHAGPKEHPVAGGKVDVFAKQAYEKWNANMTEDTAILAGDKNTEDKIKELE